MTLASVWVALAGLLLAVYVALDGFDLGAGILHLFVARTPAERKTVLKSIGPVWDGNEVWLLAGGATIFLAFPRLYAIGVSGFYLPVMILLWLLAARALGIEMKHYLHHPLWDEAWDFAFSAGSLLVTLFLGVALGNVIRGVTFDEDGRFFSPLWTDFTVGAKVGILDPYTLLVGVTATILVTLHGALWLAHRTGGEVRDRAERAARRLVAPAVVALALVTVATAFVQPLVRDAMCRPTFAPLPAMTLAGLGGVYVFLRRQDPRRAFFASAGLLVSLVASAVAGIHPYVLPGRAPGQGLLAEQAATSPYGLSAALVWWIPGVLIAAGYTVFVYRGLPSRVEVTAEAEPEGAPHD